VLRRLWRATWRYSKRAVADVTVMAALALAGTSVAAPVAVMVAHASQAPAPAQDPPRPAPDPSRDHEAESYVDSTPRGAVYNYLTAARRGDYATAARYLDLTGIPDAERVTRGPVLARQLKVVLDRTVWFDVHMLSDHPEGELSDGLPPGIERVGSIETSDGQVALLLRRVRPGEGQPVWRFSPALVDRVPALYAEFGYGWIGERVPGWLRTMRAGDLEGWQAVGLAMFGVLAALAGWGLAAVLHRLLRPLASRTITALDDRLLEVLRRPVHWLLSLVLFATVANVLNLSKGAERWLTRTLAGLLFVTIVLLLVAAVDAVAHGIRERLQRGGQTSGAGVVTFVNRLVKAFLAGIGVIGVLQAFGFDVTGLLAGLGIGGIAVALAAQKTLENLFGGLTLMADKPVQIGEYCRFGGRAGWVEEFGVRSTRIRTVERTVVSIPNAEFANVAIENVSARDRIRLATVLHLRYETTAPQLRGLLDALRALLGNHPRLARDGVRVRLSALATSSLDVDVEAFVVTRELEDFLAVQEELLLRMIEIVAANGTGFAFPSQTLYLAQDTGTAPPVRPRAGDGHDPRD